MKPNKTIIILLIIALILITGCDFIGSENRGCTAGDACRYYTGTEGIWMYEETPPRYLYYRSEDVADPDGNAIDISVRVENHGASEAKGAVFLTGFAEGMSDIFIVEDNGNLREVTISNILDACYFDLDTVGGASSLTNMFGLFSCGGFTGGNRPGGWSIGTNFKQVAETFGWNLGGLEALNFELGRDYDSGWNFKLGVDDEYFNFMYNGRALAFLVSNLDLERWGGAGYNLNGDNQDTPGGDVDYKQFKVKMEGTWPAGQDFFDIRYQLKSCYGYTTYVSPMLCIDSDPFSSEDKVCVSEQMNFGGTQGAPVTVTNVDQTNTGKELILDFEIRNSGNGKVWDVGRLEACSPYFPGSVKPSYHDVVYIGPARVGYREITCNTRKVRLDPKSGTGRFTCRVPSEIGGDVGSGTQIPLQMELWYGYEEVQTNQLTVRKLS
ncbi:hypothetical protein K9L67_01610 [Candidatus Woesearchaeota archaeon]|nr:hypothetical protein [Candidatus Woesearchaeota archaeon]MCF7900900.1 hypothetical protein [Candidatus Woesearchaeota archaeon]MCF8013051.1 hypothetical protein [Candidatus Woesearchaeota archaeon]